VTLKNTYQRGKTIIYQRAVPARLRDRYPGRTVKHDLKTNDLTVAAKAVATLNQRYDAEFYGLAMAPEAVPQSLKAHAHAFLKARGLTPAGTAGGSENHPMAVELFHDAMDRKRMDHAAGNEQEYRSATPSDYLSPVEREAWQRLHGTAPKTLSDALELHLEIHPKRDDAKFLVYQRRSFATLTAIVGNMAFAECDRATARRYLEAMLSKGLTTATVRRNMNTITAVFNTYIKENNLHRANPFAGLAIPGEGQDSAKRIPFTPVELQTLTAACYTADDDCRWILAMLADTGARLAEVVGLSLADIALDAEVPHIVIQPHPWRPLKNTGSARMVPLVGSALWAAKRIKGAAAVAGAEGQRFAFPRYTSATECKATHASNTLNKWMRANGLDHTAHELRHTLADRLRAVQCPRAVQFVIEGHSSQDVGDSYGNGYTLTVKAEWLGKVALPLQRTVEPL